MNGFKHKEIKKMMSDFRLPKLNPMTSTSKKKIIKN